MYHGFVEIFWILGTLVFTVAPVVLLVIAVVWLYDVRKSLATIASSLDTLKGGAPANNDRRDS